MHWLEILSTVVIIVLLVINPIVVVLVVNLLKRMITILRDDVASMKKELRVDIQEIQEDSKATCMEASRALAAMRNAMLDDLDAIYDGVKQISESRSKGSGTTRPT